MITAVDTNILLDILVPNERFYDRSISSTQPSRKNVRRVDFIRL
jgi:hypothetical protein